MCNEPIFKIVCFVTTFLCDNMCFIKLCMIFFHFLEVCIIKIIKNKCFGNNCGSSVRDPKVIVETNKTKKKLKTLFAKFMFKYNNKIISNILHYKEKFLNLNKRNLFFPRKDAMR